VSGTISIRPGQPPADGWPVLSWAHGTTGVADICAPSRDAPGHPSHIYNQLADATLNQWVKRGWVVSKTDYEGLGTPGPIRTWWELPRHAAPSTSCSPPASSIQASAGAGR
jgi:hypothetical protein